MNVNSSTNNNNNNQFQSQFKIKYESIDKIIRLSDSKGIFVFFKDEFINFYGRVRIKVLYGSVKIYNYQINQSTGYYDAYAPLTSNTLSINSNFIQPIEQPPITSNDLNQLISIRKKNKQIEKQLKEQELNKGKKKSNNNNKMDIDDKEFTVEILKQLEELSKLECFSSIVIVKELKEMHENSHLFKIGVRRTEILLRDISIDGFYPILRLETNIPYQPLLVPLHWSKYIENEIIQSQSHIKGIRHITIGIKDSGKSTFNRVLINQLLSVYSHIVYIDLDIGQSEFTTPGLISISIVDRPLLGPPFTHLKKPLRSYFYGDNSPRNSPEYYLDIVNQIIEIGNMISESKPGIPIIMNANGWLKGLGQIVTLEVIKRFKPTLITHLYQHNLSNLSITSNDIIQLDELKQQGNNLTRFIPLESAQVVGNTYMAGSSVLSRVAILRRYFNFESLPLTSQIPYSVEWRHYKVKIISNQVSPSQTMVALNGQVVGLCYDPIEYDEISLRITASTPQFIHSQPQLCECLGLGIIRSIDMSNSLFYIITPLSLDQVRKSNVILKGSLEIPPTPAVNITSKGTLHIPYLSFEILSSYGTGSSSMERSKNKDI